MFDTPEKPKNTEKPKRGSVRHRILIAGATLLCLMLVSGLALLVNGKACGCSNEPAPHYFYYLMTETAMAVTSTSAADNRTDADNFRFMPGYNQAFNTQTAEARIAVTAAPESRPVCYHMPNDRFDEDGKTRLQAALDAAGIEYDYAYVRADGEEYICESSMLPIGFTPKERVITLILSLPESADAAAFGDFFEHLLRAIEPVELENPAHIRLTLKHGDEKTDWRIPYHAAYQALNSGISGAELLESYQDG